jgi:hypothetical protein
MIDWSARRSVLPYSLPVSAARERSDEHGGRIRSRPTQERDEFVDRILKRGGHPMRAYVQRARGPLVGAKDGDRDRAEAEFDFLIHRRVAVTTGRPDRLPDLGEAGDRPIGVAGGFGALQPSIDLFVGESAEENPPYGRAERRQAVSNLKSYAHDALWVCAGDENDVVPSNTAAEQASLISRATDSTIGCMTVATALDVRKADASVRTLGVSAYARPGLRRNRDQRG